MKLIIAEKPSVAFDTARAITDNPVKKEGYLEAGEYTITWALGHLFEIDDAAAPQEWKLEDLPIIPDSFRYKPIKKTVRQWQIVKRLVQEADEIWVNTDAGREGELIARLILMHAGWKNWDRTYRFWTSEALTKPVILRELQAKKPAKNWDSLFYSGLGRQHGDWLVGINLTRGLTVKANDGSVWSIGRVQTPVLRLVVERDREIENFKPEPYWTVEAHFKGDTEYKGTMIFGSELFTKNKKEALEAVRQVKGQEAVVVSVDEKQRAVYPPKLFSITTLQAQANRLYGYTADRVLSIAQTLYEKKLISYPRTEAEVLDENPQTKQLVKKILQKLDRPDLVQMVDKVGRRVFNSKALTDHYAIIPMNKPKEKLSVDEENIYELIKRRFFAVFYPPYVYLEVDVLTRAGKYQFKTTGRKDIQLGWREIEPVKNRSAEPVNVDVGQRFRVFDAWANDRMTQPPDRYTEATLLEKMKQLGLGTGATRAGIIKTLKDRFYIKGKKFLVSTEKGRYLVDMVKDRPFAQVDMTAQWERFLADIYEKKLGQEGYKQFISGIKKLVKEEIEFMKQLEVESEGVYETVATCSCGGKVIDRGKVYLCSSCKTSVPKVFMGVRLWNSAVKLLFNGGTPVVNGLKSKDGKVFTAGLKLKDGKLQLEFNVGDRCQCGGIIRENSKAFYCERCKNTIWKEFMGRKIRYKEAVKLLQNGVVKMKLRSKKGYTFIANVKLKGGKLTFIS
ncbi:DNA topoisomerase [Persephonella sp.]